MLLPVATSIMVSAILLINIYSNVISSTGGEPLIKKQLNGSSSSNSNINNSSSTSHANKSTVDKFGIKEIYSTKSGGGREWYVNMSSPPNDKNFYLSGGGESTNSSATINGTSSKGQLIKQGDGSYEVHGVRKSGKYDFSVRMNVNTSDSAQWWKNVEMTGYVKVISANASDASIDLYARGRMHTSQSPCEGVAYHAGLQTDGTVFWQKEIWHTGGYTDSRNNANLTHSILGKWVGFKAIMNNINNDSAVRMETYLDDNATNHWRKVMDTIDSGGWYANAPNDLFYSANCGRSKDYVILNAGPIATFRSDNIIWDFKDLSIREIQAQPNVKINPAQGFATTNNSTAPYNPYVFGNATQEWIDKEHNIKILFSPSPEYPFVGNLTQLSFNIQGLKTGGHTRNASATVVVINNLTANTGNNNIKKGSSNGGFSTIKNIGVPNGSFSIKYQFLQPGTHQIITRINSENNNTFSVLASFSVIVLSPDSRGWR